MLRIPYKAGSARFSMTFPIDGATKSFAIISIIKEYRYHKNQVAEGPKYNQTPKKMMGLVLGSTADEYAALVAVPISQGELDAKSSNGLLQLEQREVLSTFE